MTMTLRESPQGVDLTRLEDAYRNVLRYSNYSEWTDTQCPEFTVIFEEFIMCIVEENTMIQEDQINEELHRLMMEEPFDVENGYRSQLFGMLNESMLFNELLSNNYTFTYEGTVHNSALQGVW